MTSLNYAQTKAAELLDEEKFTEVIVPVYQTIIAKEIKNDLDGNLVLVCTIVQKVVNPPEGFQCFSYRVNDESGEPFVELRRLRKAAVKDELGDVDQGTVAYAATFNCSLPMRLKVLRGVNYPFKICEASILLEMSSAFVGNCQVRPLLKVPRVNQSLDDLIGIKVKKIDGMKGDQDRHYDAEKFDNCSSHDIFQLRPVFKMEPEVKGNLIYCPKIEFKWYLEVPFWRMVINSMLPTLLLVAMQWVNYYFFMLGGPRAVERGLDLSNMMIDAPTYFGNALTLILTVIVLVPSAQEKATGRSYVNFVDIMMVFLVIGSGISAWADPIPGFIGTIVSTLSLIFPLIATWQYRKVSRQIKSLGKDQNISDFVIKSKRRGEEISLSDWKDVDIPKKKKDKLLERKPSENSVATTATSSVFNLFEQVDAKETKAETTVAVPLPNSAEKDMSVEQWLWVPDPQHEWLMCRVVADDGTNAHLEAHDGSKSFQRSSKDVKTYHTIQTSTRDRIFDNLIQLEEFSEGAILHQLRERYYRDHIYTNIGTILVSVNPFKPLPIYTANVLAAYKHRDLSSTRAPHVYETACNAYWSLMNDNENQSIIISGESGAGKTEATKVILQYLSEVATSPERVEQLIMSSNPILEAFGNAKTLRNNNSSRFGKWMEILMKNGIIVGARILNYLLEKSRVVEQAENERNYHIFYMLCAGAPQDVRDKFSINTPEMYEYLNKSGCIQIQGVDDYAQFRETLKAMTELRFTTSEIEDIWRIISGILWAGNIKFDKDGDGSRISNPEILSKVCQIFKIRVDVLQAALCFRAVTIRNEVQMIKQSLIQAIEARDSMNKALYGNLFDWLIFKINASLCRHNSQDCIGVLDIFGFEVFENNSFEQFCINLANEKLQQHFNHYIFKMEQSEYTAEGINFSSIEFVDNQECLDLIEGNPGILRLLDEEVMLPKGGDDALIEKYHKTFERHKHYDRKKTQKEVFIINHYAGAVTYDIKGFVDKNKDNIHESLSNAVKASSCELIVKIFTLAEEAVTPEDFNKTISKSPPRSGSGRARTLGSKFRTQLAALMTTLNKTSPHFVRCIKPNMEKTASNFDSVMVLKQMKYAGLFEAIRVRAQGFSYRKPHDQFFNRYKVILSKDHRKVAHDSKDTSKRCKMILEDIKLMNHKDVQVGFSKVFFRSSILNVLETQREKSMMEFTLMLQCVARGIIAKKIYRRMREVLNRAKRTIASGDAKQMEEAINYAKSMRVQIFILKQLEVAHQQAKEEERISKLLEEAINLKEAEYLDAAIEQVNKIVPKKETTKKLVSEAKKTRENLVSHERVRKQLKNAMLEENLDMLKKAVSEAKSVGFPANLLREPQELLTRLDKEEHVFKNILAAIKDDDVAHVEKLIEQTKGSNLNDDRTRVLKKAREFIFDFHTQTLKSKIKSEDVIGVMKEIKRIKEKKLASKLQDIMAEAYDFIEQKKKENPEKDYDLGDADDGTSTPPRKRDKHEKEKSRYSDEDDDNAYEREGKESHSSSHGNASDEPEWLMLSKTSMDNSKLAPLLLKQKLKNAIAQNDLELVASLLPQLESSGITDLSKTYRLGKAMLQQTSQSKVIASNIQKALNDLDREKLKELLSQARDADMEPDDNILKARKICFGCSDEEFRALLMQKYIEKKEISKIQTLIAECVKLGTNQNDVSKGKAFLASPNLSNKSPKGKSGLRPRVSSSFRTEGPKDFREQFERLKGLYPFSDLALLRDGDNYSKKSYFVKKATVETRLIYQNHPIPRTLVHMNTAYCGSKNAAKTLTTEGREMFKNVLGYMKDVYHAYPITLAQEILKRCWEEPLLRDEIYCQLIKQTSHNPSVESALLGWKLLFMCLSTFPPKSSEITDALMTHIAQVANPMISKYMSNDSISSCASNCWVALHKIVESGPKKQPPGLDEIKHITESKPMKLKVFIQSGDIIELPIASNNRELTVKGACSLLQARIDQSVPTPGELHIFVDNENLRKSSRYVVESDESIVAVIIYWEYESRNNPDIKSRFMYLTEKEAKEEDFEDDDIPPPSSNDLSSDEHRAGPPPSVPKKTRNSFRVPKTPGSDGSDDIPASNPASSSLEVPAPPPIPSSPNAPIAPAINIPPAPALNIPVPPAPAMNIPVPPAPALNIPVPPAPAVNIPVPPAPAVNIPVPPAPAVNIPVPPAPAVSIPVPPAPAVNIPVPPAPAVNISIPPAPAVNFNIPPPPPPVAVPLPTAPAINVPPPPAPIRIPAAPMPSGISIPSAPAPPSNVPTPPAKTATIRFQVPSGEKTATIRSQVPVVNATPPPAPAAPVLNKTATVRLPPLGANSPAIPPAPVSPSPPPVVNKLATQRFGPRVNSENSSNIAPPSNTPHIPVPPPVAQIPVPPPAPMNPRFGNAVNKSATVHMGANQQPGFPSRSNQSPAPFGVPRAQPNSPSRMVQPSQNMDPHYDSYDNGYSANQYQEEQYSEYAVPAPPVPAPPPVPLARRGPAISRGLHPPSDVPSPPPVPSGGDSRGDLMAQIRSGVHLRKVGAAAAGNAPSQQFQQEPASENYQSTSAVPVPPPIRGGMPPVPVPPPVRGIAPRGAPSRGMSMQEEMASRMARRRSAAPNSDANGDHFGAGQGAPVPPPVPAPAFGAQKLPASTRLVSHNSGDRSDLLAQIQSGVKLRKVNPPAQNNPVSAPVPAAPTIADEMANQLARRRLVSAPQAPRGAPMSIAEEMVAAQAARRRGAAMPPAPVPNAPQPMRRGAPAVAPQPQVYQNYEDYYEEQPNYGYENSAPVAPTPPPPVPAPGRHMRGGVQTRPNWRGNAPEPQPVQPALPLRQQPNATRPGRGIAPQSPRAVPSAPSPLSPRNTNQLPSPRSGAAQFGQQPNHNQYEAHQYGQQGNQYSQQQYYEQPQQQYEYDQSNYYQQEEQYDERGYYEQPQAQQYGYAPPAVPAAPAPAAPRVTRFGAASGLPHRPPRRGAGINIGADHVVETPAVPNRPVPAAPRGAPVRPFRR